MRQLILVVHASLDGFVAGTKGELDGFDASEENLQFVCNLTENADAALFGRISYELLNNFWPTVKDKPNATEGEIAYSSWYNDANKIVVSRTMKKENLNGTSVINDDLYNEITKIKNEPGKNILIFGSPSVAQSLMQHDLIDNYWIFINPAIFGKGIPLFNESAKRINLKLISAKQFANGEIALNYSAVR